MPLVSVLLAAGHEVSFEIDTGRTGPAYFVLSVRKSGSSFFNEICKAISRHNRYRFVDVGHGFFTASIKEIDYRSDPALQNFLRGGNVYGGFRSMPVALRGNGIFEEGPKILMIRDPRDALVSQYFSDAFSHPIPAGGPQGEDLRQLLEMQRAYARRTDIDEYVRRGARGMARTMAQYQALLGEGNTTVLKYEDYVFRKSALIRLVARQFEWDVDEQLINAILEWSDKRPSEENPASFVRRVTPGDHREKLKPETISAINETLRPAMEPFGYQL